MAVTSLIVVVTSKHAAFRECGKHSKVGTSGWTLLTEGIFRLQTSLCVVVIH